MVQAGIVFAQLLSAFTIPFALALLLIGGASAFLLTYLFTFGVIAFCKKIGWLDRPAERRVHTKAVPRLGGVGMLLAFLIASLVFYTPVFYASILGTDQSKMEMIFGHPYPKELVIYVLFVIASVFIVAFHVYDDVKGLKPLTKLLIQTITVCIILGPGLHAFHGVLLFGFSNPFGVAVAHANTPWYREPILTLFIEQPYITWLAIPAVLLTWFWMVGMMNTVNLIDGLDGLATGVVAITGLFIAIISWTLGQQSIAILAAIFTGAVLGFLPHNWNPARIFMGDTGSQFLGLGLAVLSIMGGAKVALALMVLGIPILDVAVVMINRIRRGQHPLHYDKTHLHYRLLATGLTVKQICYVFYGLTLLFGVLALNLARIYKLVGFVLVGIAMVALIVWVDYRQRERGVHIRLDGPEPPSPTGGSALPVVDTPGETVRNAPSEYEVEQVVEVQQENIQRHRVG